MGSNDGEMMSTMLVFFLNMLTIVVTPSHIILNLKSMLLIF